MYPLMVIHVVQLGKGTHQTEGFYTDSLMAPEIVAYFLRFFFVSKRLEPSKARNQISFSIKYRRDLVIRLKRNIQYVHGN